MAESDAAFFDRIGSKVVSKRKTRMPECDTIREAITGEAPPVNTGENPRWAHTGDTFWVAAQTCDRLDAGFYRFDQLPNIGPCLRKSRISIDDLIRLPDTGTAEVLREFGRFWQLEERFTARGFLHKRGILLWGPAGCLAADTDIHYQAFVAGERCFKKHVSIERLYELFHGIKGQGKGRYQTLAAGTEIRLSSVDDAGRIVSNRVVDVIKSGVKPVYRLSTASGHTIVATLDHRFLSDGKYVPLGELAVGGPVEMHLNTVINVGPNAGQGPQTGRRYCYVKHHPTDWVKVVADRYTYKVLPRARAVVEADMNGMELARYIDRLNEGNLDGLKFLDPDVDVHHRDEDCTNDALHNLEVHTHAEHARLHQAEQSMYYVTTTDHVASIEFVGKQETYDIQMEEPYHNFVANRFAVHNSGKTASLMLMAQDIVEQHDGIVCQIDHPGLATECLGYIRRIEPTRPIVALIEDLDALVERFGENGFLSLLDGEAQVNRIVFVATTNYPERLDRRFVDRPSRFDTIKWIGMPSAAARRAFLQTKEPSLTSSELEQWVKATDGFSVAHLRELVILVKCFDRPLDEAIARLEAMRLRQPKSNDSPDKPTFGIVGSTSGRGFGDNGPEMIRQIPIREIPGDARKVIPINHDLGDTL